MNCADREYRERMQIALRAAEICIFEVDLTEQRYTFFENSECIFHKSGEQILREIECYASLPQEEYQKGVTEYFSHPGDKAVVDKAFEAIGNGHSYTYEARMKAGDQEYTWCRLNVAPVDYLQYPAHKGEDGQPEDGRLSGSLYEAADKNEA